MCESVPVARMALEAQSRIRTFLSDVNQNLVYCLLAESAAPVFPNRNDGTRLFHYSIMPS